MREIKFRAWDPVGRQMIYYPLWSTLHDKTVLVFAGKVDDYVDESDFNSQVQLMQFTGLKDKREKEIYEGDVLGGDFVNFDCSISKGYIIKIPDVFYDQASDITGYEPEKCEIIGNIYENPELLEPGAKGE